MQYERWRPFSRLCTNEPTDRPSAAVRPGEEDFAIEPQNRTLRKGGKGERGEGKEREKEAHKANCTKITFLRPPAQCQPFRRKGESRHNDCKLQLKCDFSKSDEDAHFRADARFSATFSYLYPLSRMLGIASTMQVVCEIWNHTNSPSGPLY